MSRNHRLNPLWKKMQDNCHASKCCGVMSPHWKKHQTHFLFIFLFFFFYCAYCTLLRVEWRASSLPGFPPTFEQARVLRTGLEKAGFHRDNLRIWTWRKHRWGHFARAYMTQYPHGDYKLLLNATNYLLFWSQKLFLMAGRSPLKCDNSHWL